MLSELFRLRAKYYDNLADSASGELKQFYKEMANDYREAALRKELKEKAIPLVSTGQSV